MSIRPLITRLNPTPRWSVFGVGGGGGVKNPLPLSIAGLPGFGATVRVGPPLFCNTPRAGSFPITLFAPVMTAVPGASIRQNSAAKAPSASLAGPEVLLMRLSPSRVLSSLARAGELGEAAAQPLPVTVGVRHVEGDGRVQHGRVLDTGGDPAAEVGRPVVVDRRVADDRHPAAAAERGQVKPAAAARGALVPGDGAVLDDDLADAAAPPLKNTPPPAPVAVLPEMVLRRMTKAGRRVAAERGITPPPTPLPAVLPETVLSSRVSSAPMSM